VAPAGAEVSSTSLPCCFAAANTFGRPFTERDLGSDGGGEQQPTMATASSRGKATRNGMAMVVRREAGEVSSRRGDRQFLRRHGESCTGPPPRPAAGAATPCSCRWQHCSAWLVAIGMVEMGCAVFDPIGRNYETEFTSLPQPCGRLPWKDDKTDRPRWHAYRHKRTRPRPRQFPSAQPTRSASAAQVKKDKPRHCRILVLGDSWRSPGA